DAGESVAAQPLSRAGSAEEMAVAAPESGEGLEAGEAPAETRVSEPRGAAGGGGEPAAAAAPGGETREAGGACSRWRLLAARCSDPPAAATVAGPRPGS